MGQVAKVPRKKENEQQPKTVSIRPGVSILSVLRHLNYKPWFALSEFVDNSLQSYLKNREALEKVHGKDFKLTVRIDIETNPTTRIWIKDNAAGISDIEFPRAFRPAAIPNDRMGLSEFGMGMKSASCWFASKWRVRTAALGEGVERIVQFDIDQIINDQIEELDITERACDPNRSYTEVVLDSLHHVPVKKTITKIKEHLTDIYRVFIREGTLQLYFGPELLTYSEPTVLTAPYAREPDSPPQTWRKDINFDFGNGLSVKGFAALRDPGNHAKSGFALFRRNRLIVGSGDEGYRPQHIFGQPGSFRSLRLFGELHLEGFEVSHTKDGFRWDENEQPFLDCLKDELDSSELPLLKQADDYRALASKADRAATARGAVDATAKVLEKSLADILPEIAKEPPVETDDKPLAPQSTLAEREIKIDFRDQTWNIKIELTDDPAESQWLLLSDQLASDIAPQTIQIRMSLAHPFMVRYAQSSQEDLEALLRIAAALALSEKLARQAGVQFSGTIRRNLNEILLESLSRP